MKELLQKSKHTHTLKTKLVICIQTLLLKTDYILLENHQIYTITSLYPAIPLESRIS